MRNLIRSFGLWLAHTFGTRITDFETGRPLGRAFIFAWRGKIHVVGLDAAVRPLFLPQTRLTYWKQEIGFTVHPPVDFPKKTQTDAYR